MKRYFFIIWCFFYFLTAAQPAVIENVKEATTAHAEVTPASVYDEHLYQDIERNFKILNLAQENQNLRYELLAHKVDKLTHKVDKLTDQLSQLLAAKSSILTERKFEDCDDALSDAAAKDGVYEIWPVTNPSIPSFFAYCMRHPETGEAWTIIQRRINGKVPFNRDWNEYEIGFGHLNDEYWLGLKKIHALTNSRTHKLWIQLGDFENKTRSAFYDNFVVGSRGYFTLKSLGQYSGDAGDSFSFLEGRSFSLIDGHGAWWHANYKESNLNGEYFIKAAEDRDPLETRISWKSWHGDDYSLKYAHMAIRAIK